jgi:Electron transfer DM13
MRTATSPADEHVEEPAVRARRRRHRRLIVGGGLAILAAVAAFVLLYFEPQKLFIDDHVNEPFPVAAPTSSTAASPASAAPATVSPSSSAPLAQDSPTVASSPPPTTVPAGPIAERAGRFVSREHSTSGTATIYRFDDGRRVLRIEDLDTSNGPALFVYLSANPATGPESAFDDTYVDLGGLKGNIGDQNYEIPPEANLADYTSVVIWCDRFDAVFGAADLA